VNVFQDEYNTIESQDIYPVQPQPKKLKDDYNAQKNEHFEMVTNRECIPEPLNTFQILMYDSNLFSNGGDNYCFEEMRDLFYRKRLSKDHRLTKTPCKTTISQPVKEKSPNEKNGKENDDNPLFALLDATPKPSNVLFAHETPKVSSPTVHTKGAMQDIFAMFNAPLELEEEKVEDVIVDNEVIWYKPEDDETISKQVFKKIGGGISVFKDEDSDEDVNIDMNEVEKFDTSVDLQTPMPSKVEPDTNVKAVFGHPIHIMTPLTEHADSQTFIANETCISNISLDLGHQDYEPTEQILNYSFPIKVDNPCDPSNLKIRNTILKNQALPNSNLFNLELSALTTYFQDFEKSLKNQIPFVEFSNGLTVKLIEMLSHSDENDTRDCNVYLARDIHSGQLKVLKVFSYSNGWEYYIINKLIENNVLCKNIVQPKNFFLTKNESVLEMDYSGPCILDIVSKNQNILVGKEDFSVHPRVILHILTEIISIVINIHKIGIIHGDLRIGNFLMETSKDVHELQVDDFENIQLKVIDFGASIDLNSFPDQQTFSISVDSSNGTDEYFECWEFRHGKEWIYEPDWFQVAGILHLLLFGKILRVKETKSDNEKPDISITNKLDDDEYKELWQHTFKALLNYQSTFDDESENKIKELESLLISRK
jgi:hypothetical protein